METPAHKDLIADLEVKFGKPLKDVSDRELGEHFALDAIRHNRAIIASPERATAMGARVRVGLADAGFLSAVEDMIEKMP